MESLRTLDERFANLPGYAFAPHYVEVGDTTAGEASLRMTTSTRGRARPRRCCCCTASRLGRIFIAR